MAIFHYTVKIVGRSKGKSVRYKRSEDKEAALEKFKITFQKQRLWNEVLKIEKNADAQLGRSFEFALPKEWNRQEQIQYTTDYIQKTFVDRGMCADWSIHDKVMQRHSYKLLSDGRLMLGNLWHRSVQKFPMRL